ncbi:MAG: DinB family protein [Knoellia sp.]
MTSSESTAPTFRDEQLLGATFAHVDLSDARFTMVDLSRSRFHSVDLADVEIRDASLARVRMRGVELLHVEVWGELDDVRINGIDIAPLVSAELDRRHPERALLRPSNAEGFRNAWSVIDDLWSGTVERARQLEATNPELLHESVEGEWSFIETLRHLAFATSSWLSRALLGDPSPWHPLELPWDEMRPTPGVPQDREARPSLDDALALRHDRFERVRAHLAFLTDEELAVIAVVPGGAGWPPAGEEVPVKQCLDTLLNEEWWHRQFAERDLTTLEARLART